VYIATVIGTDGKVLYPKGPASPRGPHPGWTPRRVKQAENRSKRSGLFSSQYLMQPVSSDHQAFKAENYRWYKDIPDDKTGCTIMTIDPAVSEKKQGDHQAFVVVTLTHDGCWYIRDLVRQRSMGVNGIIETAYALWGDYRSMLPRDKIVAIGVEANSLQKTFLHVFQTEWRLGGRQELPILPVRASNVTSKEFNIRRITHIQEAGRIYLPAPLPDDHMTLRVQRPACPDGLAALLNEGERFPLGNTDDCIDALSMVIDLPYYPEPPQEEEKKTRVEQERERSAAFDGKRYMDEVLGDDW